MSSARSRMLPNVGRALRGIAWTALFAVLAAGAAGLIDAASHAPGGPARADLTYTGDAALHARLDEATAQLQAISAVVDALAEDAKVALEEVASTDSTKLDLSLLHGTESAAAIQARTAAVLASLAGLPGDEPDAPLRYSNATLVRRAAVLAALDAAGSLAGQWEQVATKADEVSELTGRIAEHDRIVLDAAAKGTKRQFADAARGLDDAILAIVDVKALRTKLISDAGETVLDEWIERNRDYDIALQALYVALVQSGGNPNTPKVVAARRAERDALKGLPPDRRTIIVIVAEVARGGFTQAVLAIEDASGRLDDALAEAGPSPSESGGPGGPGESGSPAETLSPAESGTPLP